MTSHSVPIYILLRYVMSLISWSPVSRWPGKDRNSQNSNVFTAKASKMCHFGEKCAFPLWTAEQKMPFFCILYCLDGWSHDEVKNLKGEEFLIVKNTDFFTALFETKKSMGRRGRGRVCVGQCEKRVNLARVSGLGSLRWRAKKSTRESELETNLGEPVT